MKVKITIANSDYSGETREGLTFKDGVAIHEVTGENDPVIARCNSSKSWSYEVVTGPIPVTEIEPDAEEDSEEDSE